jgi:hypothetical protein
MCPENRESACSRRLFELALALGATQVWLSALLIIGWRHGVERGFILGGLLAGLMLLRFRPRPIAASVAPDSLPQWLRILLIAALIADFGIAGGTISRSLRTGLIPMDQGQTTWRAARLLWRGENPYGVGALVDPTAFALRSRARQDAGIAQTLSGAALDAALWRYDETLDPAVRNQILPVPQDRPLTESAAQEARLAGYKYGPVLIIATVPFAVAGIPAGVVLLNSIVCFGLFAVFWILLQRQGCGRAFAALGLLGEFSATLHEIQST